MRTGQTYSWIRGVFLRFSESLPRFADLGDVVVNDETKNEDEQPDEEDIDD